jgi:hypothetical protein
MTKEKALISFIAFICCCLPACAGELSEYQAVKCIVHLHTNISGGTRPLESYVIEAREKGIGAIVLTDADWRRWEYGLPPFRGLLKKTVQKKSVMTFGMERYLKLIEDTNRRHKDIIVIDGVQTNPFYYWSGNFFKGTMTLNNRNKDMLVIGFGDADSYTNMPLVVNRKSRFDAYHDDKFSRPYQDLIDYVTARGGLVFWSHPEYEENILKGRIRLLTPPSSWELVSTYGYTGFGVYWHGYKKTGRPKGIWDRVLSEYCEGRRESPVWAVGELEEEGMGNIDLDDVINVVYVDDLSRRQILDALKKGRFYVAFEPSDKNPPVLEEFTLAGGDGTVAATMGEETSFSGNPVIKIRVAYDHTPVADMRVRLIRNNKVIEEFSGASVLEIEYTDEETVAGQKYYYRIEVTGLHSSRLISNPIFFRKI